MSSSIGTIRKVAALRGCTEVEARAYCLHVQDNSDYAVSFKEIAKALGSFDGRKYELRTVIRAARQVRLAENKKKDIRKKKKHASQLKSTASGGQTSKRISPPALIPAQGKINPMGEKDGLAAFQRSIRQILEEGRCLFPRASRLLSDELIAEWFATSLPNVPCREYHPSITGFGPLPINDLSSVRRFANAPIYEMDRNTDLLIIGRSGWKEAELNRLLDQRLGKKSKVYSQEMFFVHWASTCDPFENENVIRDFGIGNPALEFLSSRWYAWPSTIVSLDSSSGLQIDSPEVGILSHMGYRVGKSGCPTDERIKILTQVFRSHLEFVDSNAYMRGWGTPQSLERLKKLADSIAAFCRFHQKLGHVEAAADYEHDLDWLYNSFYCGRFRFQWPKARII
jgi:hypothetical protein